MAGHEKMCAGLSSVSRQILQVGYFLEPSGWIFIPPRCPVLSLVRVFAIVLLVVNSQIWFFNLMVVSLNFDFATDIAECDEMTGSFIEMSRFFG